MSLMPTMDVRSQSSSPHPQLNPFLKASLLAPLQEQAPASMVRFHLSPWIPTVMASWPESGGLRSRSSAADMTTTNTIPGGSETLPFFCLPHLRPSRRNTVLVTSGNVRCTVAQARMGSEGHQLPLYPQPPSLQKLQSMPESAIAGLHRSNTLQVAPLRPHSPLSPFRRGACFCNVRLFGCFC